jgi:hypothetical protein
MQTVEEDSAIELAFAVENGENKEQLSQQPEHGDMTRPLWIRTLEQNCIKWLELLPEVIVVLFFKEVSSVSSLWIWIILKKTTSHVSGLFSRISIYLIDCSIYSPGSSFLFFVISQCDLFSDLKEWSDPLNTRMIRSSISLNVKLLWAIIFSQKFEAIFIN